MTPDSTPPQGGDHGVPRWVAVTLAFLAVLVAAALLAMFLTGGDHGPGRHLGAAIPAPSSFDR